MSPEEETSSSSKEPIVLSPTRSELASSSSSSPTRGEVPRISGILKGRRRSSGLSQVTPPGYFPPRQPGARKYEFQTESFNATRLFACDGLSPDYHISVQMNCFMPSSFVTTIRRDSEDGPVVGSFEMGISTKPGSVTMFGTEKLISAVLIKVGSRNDKVWQWCWHNNTDLHLSWHGEDPRRFCYLRNQIGSSGATILATFEPQPMTPRADGTPSPPPSLKFFPEGQQFLEDILISALILERQRLTPQSSSGFRWWFV